MLFDEDLGEAETTTRKVFGITVADEGDAFFADFGEVDFPSHLGEQFGVDLGALGLLRWAGLVARTRFLGGFRSFGIGGERGGVLFAGRGVGIGGVVRLAFAFAAAALALGGIALRRCATCGFDLGLRPLSAHG